jgi:hypothetical protein
VIWVIGNLPLSTSSSLPSTPLQTQTCDNNKIKALFTAIKIKVTKRYFDYFEYTTLIQGKYWRYINYIGFAGKY